MAGSEEKKSISMRAFAFAMGVCIKYHFVNGGRVRYSKIKTNDAGACDAFVDEQNIQS